VKIDIHQKHKNYEGIINFLFHHLFFYTKLYLFFRWTITYI
jgi:hypothetical protein